MNGVKTSLLTLLTALLIGLVGCSSEIGDGCKTSVDCSIRGDRLCDVAQPSGYCTVRDCEPNTCPDKAVCVEFRPNSPRLATAWCMARCSDSSDCRNDEGYSCVRATEFGEGVAAVIDQGRENQGFCAANPAK